ncbi:MAG TPA: hypothetical protein VK934_02085 [Fimbriimonas sp.]|nr:hypothetical protein [Fimbriimonas sp.]
MKEQVKTPAIVVAVLVVVGLVVFLSSKAMTAGNLDQGQVQYTPGKPPWEESDPAKRGPGASPGAAPPANAPPGMGAPVLGNSGQ